MSSGYNDVSSGTNMNHEEDKKDNDNKNESSTKSNSLEILQFNIQSCTGLDGVYDIARTASVIKDSLANLVALQEIEVRCQTTCFKKPIKSAERRAADQPKELAALTGLQCVFEEKTDSTGGSYGTAAMSGLPILQQKALHFKTWDTHHGSNLIFGKLPQVAVALLVHPPTWSLPVWFISTHLGCDSSGKEQAAEAEEMLEFANSLTATVPGHVVISADFNCPPYFKAIKVLLKAQYTDCWNYCVKQGTAKSQACCFKGATHLGVLRLDYVFVSTGLNTTRAEVINSKASDHKPLSVTLEESASPLSLTLENNEYNNGSKKKKQN